MVNVLVHKNKQNMVELVFVIKDIMNLTTHVLHVLLITVSNVQVIMFVLNVMSLSLSPPAQLVHANQDLLSQEKESVSALQEPPTSITKNV